MPNLNPGQRAGAARAARLLVALSGPGVRSAAIELAPSSGLRMRPAGQNQWVVEADGIGNGRLRLVAASGAAISGAIRMSVRTVALQGGVAAGQEWVLTRLEAEGRTRLDALAVERDEQGNWTLESLLLAETPLADDQISRLARHHWGDRPQSLLRCMVAVDRSASMAWAYPPSEALTGIVHALRVALAVGTEGGGHAPWCTYGSGVGVTGADRDGVEFVSATTTVAESQNMARPGAGPDESRAAPAPTSDTADPQERTAVLAAQATRALTPSLFSSGSDPALVGAAAAAREVGLMILVSDDLSAGLAARAASGRCDVALIVAQGPGASGEESAEDRATLGLLAGNGIAVLRLPPGPGAIETAARWALDRISEATNTNSDRPGADR